MREPRLTLAEKKNTKKFSRFFSFSSPFPIPHLLYQQRFLCKFAHSIWTLNLKFNDENLDRWMCMKDQKILLPTVWSWMQVTCQTIKVNSLLITPFYLSSLHLYISRVMFRKWFFTFCSCWYKLAWWELAAWKNCSSFSPNLFDIQYRLKWKKIVYVV